MSVSTSGGKRLGRAARPGSRSKSGSREGSRAADRSACSTLALNSKQRGELAEMMFMVKAAQKGFATAKPYGDSRRYDLIVDVGQRLWRVQVKSASVQQYGSYQVNLQRNLNGEVVFYEASEIDFVVAFVFPCEAWFVISVGGDLRTEDGEDVSAGESEERKAGEILGGVWADDFAVGERGGLGIVVPRSRKNGATLRLRSGQALERPASRVPIWVSRSPVVGYGFPFKLDWFINQDYKTKQEDTNSKKETEHGSTTGSGISAK
jgi:hypothetical protein